MLGGVPVCPQLLFCAMYGIKPESAAQRTAGFTVYFVVQQLCHRCPLCSFGRLEKNAGRLISSLIICLYFCAPTQSFDHSSSSTFVFPGSLLDRRTTLHSVQRDASVAHGRGGDAFCALDDDDGDVGDAVADGLCAADVDKE